jgi:DNA-binding transcriptional ArsR family regulator
MSHAAATLDSTFQALADPTRRALIAQLRGGVARVTDLADQHAMSLNAVSKHIKVLEGAGLVERKIEGREHLIGLRAEPLAEAEAWIEEYREFWLTRLGRLDRLMKDRTSQTTRDP